VPYDLLRPYAVVAEGELVYTPDSKRAPLMLRRRVEYRGFELEREQDPIDEFPPERAQAARNLLAEALARGEARHPGARANLDAIESVRETYRRSGGKTPRLSLADLTAIYEVQLANVNSMTEFRHARVTFDADTIVPREVRERYASLPTSTTIRDREVEIHYEVEETPSGPVGYARLRIPEKIARTLAESELPALDRPLRFIVMRGARGAARADTLEALQEELDRPFTREEIADLEQAQDNRRKQHSDRKHEQKSQHKHGHRGKRGRDDGRGRRR
jgi:hypothetical protein